MTRTCGGRCKTVSACGGRRVVCPPSDAGFTIAPDLPCPGVHALVDKPPTLPVPFDPDRILAEFDSVLDLARDSLSDVAVTVQRRHHPGYKLVHKLVSDVVQTWGVPLSFVDIYHGDGMWCMPGELATREQHPYKYGYGKVMHSGYHFLDLLLWLQSVNDTLLPDAKRPDSMEVTSRHLSAQDVVAQVTPSALGAMTGAAEAEVAASYQQFRESAVATELGELNMHALVQFVRSAGRGPTSEEPRVVCTASVNLLQNSLSRRAWFHPRADVYKGNGRVRHERVVLNVGNLLSVHVHSYQSHEAGQPDGGGCTSSREAAVGTHTLLAELGLDEGWERRDPSTSYGEGHEDHFDVTIYRNSAIIGGPAFEHVPIGHLVKRQAAPPWAAAGIGLAHNEFGRARILEDWSNGRVSGTASLHEQRPTMELAARLYADLRCRRETA